MVHFACGLPHVMQKATIYAIGIFVVAFAAASYARADQISNVTVTGLTNNSATINWSTDVDTDATVNYGLDSSVGIIRDSGATSTSHSLVIPGLQPATTYYFRVVSTDQSGDTTATAGFVFTTTGSQADKAIQDISKITDPQALVQVAQSLQQQA